ncbi:hypothetical protein MR626_06000, partial [bacterium]|nr:hypothetical protein [bacterium]
EEISTLPLIRHGFAVPPSPEGEGFALRNPYKHQFIGQLNKADKHIRKYETEMRKRYASY